MKEKNILNAIYLKAETIKITGILGRNGSGKNSLLRIIFGALTPKSKLFRIDHKPFLKKPYLTVNDHLYRETLDIADHCIF